MRRKTLVPLPVNEDAREHILDAVDARVPTCNSLDDARVLKLENDSERTANWHQETGIGGAAGLMVIATAADWALAVG